MIPVARKDNLVIQEFEDELIIADDHGNAAHCLTPIAARVWEYCDGYNTINDIAHLVEDDLDIPLDKDVDMRGLIWITLEELQRYGLIKEYLNQPLSQPISDANLSRRKMLKRLSIAGGFAAGAIFPAVRSMMMPEPAMAACSGDGGISCCVRPSDCPPERWNQSECKCTPLPPPKCPPLQDIESFETMADSYAEVNRIGNQWLNGKDGPCEAHCLPCKGNFEGVCAYSQNEQTKKWLVKCEGRCRCFP
jgi:hypothetical protein